MGIVNKAWNNQLSGHRRNLEYVREFRTGYDTFWELTRLLGPYICRQDTRFRPAISDPHRVAIALWRVAHGASYNMITSHLGIGESTARYICEEVLRIICEKLLHVFIKFPEGDRLHFVMNRFMSRYEMHMCVGAVDGSHIPIVAPRESPEDYRNRKGFHSINLQGCVDYSGLFIDTFIGFPGKAHDSRVFRHSSLAARMAAGTLFPNTLQRTIQGEVIYPYILGDPGQEFFLKCSPNF